MVYTLCAIVFKEILQVKVEEGQEAGKFRL
jgi:hypothetical protein